MMRKLHRKLDRIYVRPVVESATNPEYLREVALALLAEEERMTVYEVIDGYFRRFGLFTTRDKAEEWAKENPLHYFVGIKKVLATPAENRYRIKEVSVA